MFEIVVYYFFVFPLLYSIHTIPFFCLVFKVLPPPLPPWQPTYLITTN